MTFLVLSGSAAIVRSEIRFANRIASAPRRVVYLAAGDYLLFSSVIRPCRRILYSAEDIFCVRALRRVSPRKSRCRYTRRIFVLMEEISSSLECPRSLPSAQHGEKSRLICKTRSSRGTTASDHREQLLLLARADNRFVGLGGWIELYCTPAGAKAFAGARSEQFQLG
jgi:hypothetical protein